jgi:hypothetical protein
MKLMPLYLVLFQYLPELALLVSIGMVLIGYQPKLKQVLPIAAIGALASYGIRSLPLPYGVNIILQLPVMILLTTYVCKLSLLHSVSVNSLGLVLLWLIESVCNPLIAAVSGVSVQQALQQPWLRLLYPLPDYLLIFVAVLVLNRQHIALFNIQELRDIEQLKGHEE